MATFNPEWGRCEDCVSGEEPCPECEEALRAMEAPKEPEDQKPPEEATSEDQERLAEVKADLEDGAVDWVAEVDRLRERLEANVQKCRHHPDRTAAFFYRDEAGEPLNLCQECEGNRAAVLAQDHARRLREQRAATVHERVAQVVGRRYVGKQLKDLRGYPLGFVQGLVRVAEDMTSALFLGPNGTGKTHAAAAIYQRHYLAGTDVAFYPLGELMDQLRLWVKEHGSLTKWVNDLRKVGVLFLDDVGGERLTDFAAEGLFRILDWRDRDGSPTIITTNLEEEALREHVGDRSVSRILGLTAGHVFVFTGEDRRDEASA